MALDEQFNWTSWISDSNQVDCELTYPTCVTMTSNGRNAIVGHANGAPQMWDTTNGILIRQMFGYYANISNLALARNDELLVGLVSNESLKNHALSLQLWEVQSGIPLIMSHQVKCCVFVTSSDSNAIYMAGNQRFGRGISVGVLNLVTNELVKEVKSDPNISFGESLESISITPDERHAIVGCRSPSGTNFVVFDLIEQTTETALKKSIAFDADPKCIQVLNNNEVLTGTRDGHLLQWNLDTCQITMKYTDSINLPAHKGSINQISLSENKEFLVSASSDGTAKIWNTRQKSLINVLTYHTGEVTCASISNSNLVITGSTDQTVGIWQLYGLFNTSVGMIPIQVDMPKHNRSIVAIGKKDGEQRFMILNLNDTEGL